MNKKRLPLKHCAIVLLLLAVHCFSFAQTRVITGTVTDEESNPIVGANVVAGGTVSGAQTDNRGKFSLAIPASVSRIIVSYTGFESRELSVTDQTDLTIRLKRSFGDLNEVLVIGYSTVKRKDLTGSVGSVSGNTFKNQPITDASEALQGRIAGVNVVKNSNEPGAGGASVIIRGLVSLNQPAPLYIVDGVRVADATNVNPQDIESVDVLKDAAAAAIYGASAAGGVVIITTRKGSGTKPTINFSARYGATNPKVGELLDKDGYIALQNIINPGRFTNATRLDTLPNTDWIKETFRNGKEQNYNLSFSGAYTGMDYLISGFYNGVDGVARKSYSDIGGARINSNFKLGKIFKVGEQVAFSRRKTSNPQNVGVEAQLHNSPFRTLPIIAVRDKDGDYGILPPGYPGLAFGGTHPVGAIDNALVQNFKDNLQANVYGEVKLPLHLSFRTNVGYSYYVENQDYFQNAFSIGGVGSSSNSLSKLFINSRSLLTNYVLTYNNTIGDHSINAVGGFEQITGKYSYSNTKASNVNADAGKLFSFVNTDKTAYEYKGYNDNNQLIKSLFGRVDYNYANKYYLSGSLRQDANFTTFGPGKQRGVFPSASVGWTLSEEKFMSSISAINTLKLRASYGELGNSNIGTYRFLAVYEPFSSLGNGSAGGSNYSPGGPIIPGLALTSIPNQNLQWETLQETNIGLDGELLNRRLYFTVEWYNKQTKDMLYALPLPPSAGFSTPYLVNIGTVQNKGMDFLVGYKDRAGEFTYDISVNAGFNKNEVTKLSDVTTSALYDGYNYYNPGDVGFQMMPNLPITITKKGLPFGSFYGFKTLGLFATDEEASKQKVNGNVAHAGDLHFEDMDGNGEINDEDRQVIGNPNPKLVYGSSIRLGYKGFDLNLLLTGVAGVDIFNGVKAYEMRPFADGNTSPKVWGASYLNGNGLTGQPRLGIPSADNSSFSMDPNGNYSSVNSYFVEKGDYLKIKNIQVGYNFSSKLLDRAHIKNARIFLMGNNLVTFTKYSGLDPELGASFSPSGFSGVTARGIDVVSQYPQVRTYSIGIDLTF